MLQRSSFNTNIFPHVWPLGMKWFFAHKKMCQRQGSVVLFIQKITWPKEPLCSLFDFVSIELECSALQCGKFSIDLHKDSNWNERSHVWSLCSETMLSVNTFEYGVKLQKHVKRTAFVCKILTEKLLSWNEITIQTTFYICNDTWFGCLWRAQKSCFCAVEEGSQYSLCILWRGREWKSMTRYKYRYITYRKIWRESAFSNWVCFEYGLVYLSHNDF